MSQYPDHIPPPRINPGGPFNPEQLPDVITRYYDRIGMATIAVFQIARIQIDNTIPDGDEHVRVIVL